MKKYSGLFAGILFITIGLLFLPSTKIIAKRSLPPNGQYSQKILQEVLEKITKNVQDKKNPVVVFDLDETLINSRGRGLLILNDFLSTTAMKQKYPAAQQKIFSIVSKKDKFAETANKMEAFPYAEQILKELNLDDPKLIEEVSVSYGELYLSNAYCAKDLLLPGAVNYVNKIYAAGAQIVYLTGRNRPGMSICTEESLSQNKLPKPGQPRVTLIMKPERTADDKDFKAKAVQDILKLGPVVAGFENEPANINVFKAGFPEAICVFIDSAHSDRPDVPTSGIFYIRDFYEK